MNALGDVFPESWRKDLAKENIKIGAVIRIEVPETTPPKIKRLIIVGIEDQKKQIATIFINSEINANVLNTPELQALQHELKAAHCPYLTHDSYADCSIIKERNYSEILSLIETKPSSHVLAP